jgi:hypothetical protein
MIENIVQNMDKNSDQTNDKIKNQLTSLILLLKTEEEEYLYFLDFVLTCLMRILMINIVYDVFWLFTR